MQEQCKSELGKTEKQIGLAQELYIRKKIMSEIEGI